jgi:hypothetical protein
MTPGTETVNAAGSWRLPRASPYQDLSYPPWEILMPEKKTLRAPHPESFG